MPRGFSGRGLISEIYNSTCFSVCKPLFEKFFEFFIACRRKDDFCCGVRVCGLREKKAKKISVFFNFGVDIWGEIAYNNFRTKRNGELCNGSTYDSDSYCLGSNPSSPAISLHGQAVKTSPSQGEIRGSIPLGAASEKHRRKSGGVFLCFSSILLIWPRRAMIRPSFVPRFQKGRT